VTRKPLGEDWLRYRRYHRAAILAVALLGGGLLVLKWTGLVPGLPPGFWQRVWTLSLIGVTLGSLAVFLALRYEFRFSLRSIVVLLLFATSATGLCFRSSPWQRSFVVKGRPFCILTERDCLVTHDPDGQGHLLWNAGTGKSLGSYITDGHDSWSRMAESSEGTELTRRAGPVRVRSGSTLREYVLADRDCAGIVSEDGRRIALEMDSGNSELWRLRRPEAWWGIFRLWEFWLTVFFAAALAWSLIADRRRLRAPSPAPPPSPPPPQA